MADDNHGQMIMQQQNPPQQPHMQPGQGQLQQSQLQQSQLQQSQLQQSQLQQNQMQQSQMQQAQIQQSQLQQSQIQQSQLQQSQIQQQVQLQQSQLQQSQLQQQAQLQQPQLQQTQLQQSQLQQSPAMQQQSQQQPASMSMGNTVEQSNMNVSTTVPLNVATINVSQAQQMQGIQQSVNTSSGTPVQMAVSQLTAQGQTISGGTMMSQSSGPHPTMMHPTMTMAQAQLPQVQMIQPSYLYSPQQMIFPSNLIQHAGMGTPTLQNLGAQGLSLQLQAKATLDPKTSVAQNIQAVNAANKQSLTVNAGTMMTTSGQVIGTGPKSFPQQMLTGPGKSTIIHSQSGFAPSNANQTVVIGQLGVLPNQQSIFNHKAIADSQKGKFTFQNQPTALQPKSLYSSNLHSSAQVFNGSHLKQITSQPQIITTQPNQPGTMFSQAHQFVDLQTLPPGLWASGSFQPTLLGQNPVFIRSQQSNMIIQQSQPQAAMHLSVAAQPVPPTSFSNTAAIAPQKQKQVRMRPTTHSVAVGTQTHVSSATTMHSNTAPIRTQIKPKGRASMGMSPGVSPAPLAPQMATTQTQTNQSPAQSTSLQPIPQQKSDAGNQTYPKTANQEVKNMIPPIKDTKLSPQAMVAPSTKIPPPQMAIPPMMDASIATVTSTIVTVSSSMPVLSTSTVHVNSSVSTVNAVSAVPSPVPEAKASFMSVKNDSETRKLEELQPLPTSQPMETKEASSGIEHLKPQQPIMKPSLGQVKDKQPPQKAIVKPQVLTHIIDGLVIQEGPEPFPVSRSALLDSPGRILPSEKGDSQLKRKDSPTVSSPDKKMKMHRARGNVELAKCEFCGKLGPKSKFKRSKRFCSNSCAKRYAQGPKRDPETLPPGGPGRKKKMGGYRGRKGSKKQAELEEGEVQLDENLMNPEEEIISIKIEDDIVETPVENTQQIPMELKSIESEVCEIDLEPSQKMPNKWTVQDVFDFIRTLPGCSESADKFRSQEIDGQALLLLKEDHLIDSMSMKLGPAVKLISQIRSWKEKLNLS